MKKIKKLLLVIILFLPLIVKAYDYNDIEFKWKNKLDFDIYYNFGSLDSNGNYETIMDNNYLYVILGDEEILWIDKLTGQIDSYDIYSYEIKTKNNTKYIFGRQDQDAHLLKLDEKNLIEKKVILENQNKHTIFVEEDKIIVITYNKNENNKYEYYVNIYDNDLNHIEKHTTTLPQSISSCDDLNHSFSDNYNKYYYLNKEYKIVPYTVEENGDYTVFDGTTIKTVDKDANIKQEYSIPKKYSYQDGKVYKETNEKKYILTKEREKISSTNSYNSYATLYIFDNNSNLLASKNVGSKTNHPSYSSISASMYLNEDKIILYVDGNYYEVNESYNMIQTTSDAAKNSFVLSYEKYDDDYYYDDYETYEKIEDALEEHTENITENDIYYDFDYLKSGDSYYASVTWTYECVTESETRSCYTHNDIITLDSKFNIVNIKNYSEKELITEDRYGYEFEARNSIIKEFNGYIIVSFGGMNRNTLRIYNKDLSLFKNFDDVVEESLHAPRAIVYSKNGFLVINKQYSPPPTNIASDVARKSNDQTDTEMYYFEFPYEVSTKVTGKGTITIEEDKSRAGENIKFVVTPEEGYVLGEIKVTDSEGNVLIFTDYEFTMPTADIVIEATFNPIPMEENPETSDFISMFIVFTILILEILLIRHFNKKIKE